MKLLGKKMIQLKNITKKFQINKTESLTALKEINLEIKEGELIILKGASGSGKSTILSLIAALSKPTSGEVIVDNKRISKLPDNFASLYRRDNIGFIFQKFNLITTISVANNIILPLVPSNLEAKELEKKLSSVMEKFSISHKREVITKNLSGGEQQRVAIARALINNPKIIIADEPTANLDAKLSFDFLNIIKELKNQDKTIIIATHDPIFFDFEYANREIEIKNGEICS